MTTPAVNQFPRERGATGELFSPSDARIIRIDDWRRDRGFKRPAPSLSLLVCVKSDNDNTPPTPAAPAIVAPRLPVVIIARAA